MESKLMNRRGMAIAVLSWSFCGTALAQSGCVNSPENPSVVLGALALAAAGVPWLRAKWQERRKP